MSARKKIQHRQFIVISREVKDRVADHRYNAEKLAKYFGVSRTTISTIKRVKTWPAFQAHKAARHTSSKVSPAEKQLVKELSNLEVHPVEYVTKKQFTDALDSLNGKITQDRTRADIHRKEIDELMGWSKMNTRILNRIQKLKPRWFKQD